MLLNLCKQHHFTKFMPDIARHSDITYFFKLITNSLQTEAHLAQNCCASVTPRVSLITLGVFKKNLL